MPDTDASVPHAGSRSASPRSADPRAAEGRRDGPPAAAGTIAAESDALALLRLLAAGGTLSLIHI